MGEEISFVDVINKTGFVDKLFKNVGCGSFRTRLT